MPTLIRSMWQGKPRYCIEYDRDRSNGSRKPDPAVIRVAITDGQAAQGLDLCSVMYVAGRL